MKKDLVEAVKIRVHNDYEALIKDELKKDKNYIINSAYMIAHFNEIDDFFGNMDEDDDYSPLDEEECKKVLCCKENIVLKIWNVWLNYRHPEYYNFFTYEGLIDIIRSAFYKGE